MIERVRKRCGLSCDSATASREKGRDKRVIERVRKRPRVIFGIVKCMLQTAPYRWEKKRWNDAVLRLKQRQPFESVTVHRTRRLDHGSDGSMLFLHGTVLHLKRTVKLNDSQVSRLDRTVRSRFYNLG